MTDWTIRQANHGDATAVADLWTEAYVTSGTGGRTVPYAEADVIDSLQHADVSVAEQQDEIVGAVVLHGPEAGREISEPDEAQLTRLAVAPLARRMGMGRALARFCEERARAAGWAAITLWSRPAQVEAHRLYESLGYRRVPGRDSIDQTGGERLVFRLQL